MENKGLEISGKQSLYNKQNDKIIFEDNVSFIDKFKNILVQTDKAVYDNFKDVLKTQIYTKIFFENSYEIISKNMTFDRISDKIYSNDTTIIKDQNGNIYNIENKFILDVKNEIISTEDISIVDENNNIYHFENAKVNLKTNEILGKEIKVDFEDGYFGNLNNDPILKGDQPYQTR